jgi:hypothetical protein
MHLPTALPAGLIGSVLVLVACSGDQPAPTAPTTRPSFSTVGSAISAQHEYSFSLSCHNSSPASQASVTESNGKPTFSLSCAGSEVVGAGSGDGFGGFTSFDYTITLNDATPAVISCTRTDVTTTGAFKCSSKKWAATLTLTDLGVPPP